MPLPRCRWRAGDSDARDRLKANNSDSFSAIKRIMAQFCSHSLQSISSRTLDDVCVTSEAKRSEASVNRTINFHYHICAFVALLMAVEHVRTRNSSKIALYYD